MVNIKPKEIRLESISKEQGFLKNLFGSGEKVMFNNPESESLPHIHGALFTGAKTTNADQGETGNLFGLRR